MVFSLHMDHHQLHMPTFHTSTPNLRNKDDNSTTALTRTKAMFAKKASGYQDHFNPLTSVTATKSHHVAEETAALPLRGCTPGY